MFVCTERSLFGFVCLLVISIACASGDYDTRGSESLSENGGERRPQEGLQCLGNNCVKRTVGKDPAAMWFGPRLGRRRRSGHKSEMNSKDFESIAEVINSAPWALISVPDAKRQSTQFIPRLGRELDDEFLYGQSYERDNQKNQDLNEKARYINFIPRPGRVARPDSEISEFQAKLPFLPPPRPGRELQDFRI